MTSSPNLFPSGIPTLPASGVRAAALLRQDQRRRWLRGQRPRVEDYLERYPALRADPDALLDLIYGEFALREELGEAPAAEEYLARFPAQADSLREQLDLHRCLNRNLPAAPSEAASTPAAPPFVEALVPSTRHAAAAETDVSAVPEGPAGKDSPAAVTVPGYEILGALGKGGMGVVYKARQLALGRTVALKRIRYAEDAGDEERRRFRAEAEAVASLQHPNIVQIHEVGEHDGLPYFSLEFCGGGSLEKQLDGTPWESKRAAALVGTLARAVQAAHRKGLIHRDLKPANVLVAEDDTPKITDFGLAKKIDVRGETPTGAIVGTPSYMAPEQAGGKKEIGPAADVYALGAILYELLTGRPPFLGATPLDTVLQVLSDEPVPVRRLQPKVPRDLETICHKCLEKEPRKRYTSAGDLAEDLRRFGAGEPIRARTVGRLERGWKWARRNPWVAGLLAAVVLVSVTGALVSTLFALEARRQAGEARTSAEEAGREKTRAVENAGKAEQKEQEATRTLLEGLLRPLGRALPNFNSEGENYNRLDSAEVNAVTELGRLSGDPLRLRLLELGLETPPMAERLDRRADWVVQGVVGLDAGRRQEVEKLLRARLGEPGAADEVRLACIRLGNVLEVQDPAFNTLAAETLLAALERNRDNPKALVRFSSTLGALCGRLEAAPAAGYAGKAAETLVPAVVRTADSPLGFDTQVSLWALEAVGGRLDASGAGKAARALAAALDRHAAPVPLLNLSQGLRAVSERLDAAGAGKAAEALEAAIDRSRNNAWPLEGLAEVLSAVTGRLNQTEAAVVAGKAAEVLLAALRKDNPNDFRHLLAGLIALSGRLDAAGAGRAAETLVAVIEKHRDEYGSFSNLVQALSAVCGRMDAAAAAGHARKAVEARVAALDKTTGLKLAQLSGGLPEICARLDTAGAAKLAEALLASLDRHRNTPNDLYNLAMILQAVNGRLEEAQATACAGKAAELLGAALDKHPGNVFDLVNLSRCLETMSGRLDKAQVRFHAGKAAQALVAALHEQRNNPAALLTLSTGLGEVCGRLDVAQARAHADRAARTLMAALDGHRNNAEALRTLSAALVAVSEWLDAPQAAACAGKAAEILVAAMDRNDPFALLHLSASLGAVSERLDAAGAGKAAEALEAAIDRNRDNPAALLSLSASLVAVSTRLDAVRSATSAARAAESLVAAMSQANTDDNASLFHLFENAFTREGGMSGELSRARAVIVRLSTPDLAATLRHPLAAGRAQRLLLDVLGQRTRRQFRNTWHFLDWAASNGVDLTLPRTGAPPG